MIRWTMGLAALVACLVVLVWVDGRRTLPEATGGVTVVEKAADTPSEEPGAIDQSPSRCFGTVSEGRLENAWRLPQRGDNFQVYSGLGWQLGRTYVHSTVHDIVLEAYASLRISSPELQFVYGETGLENGGRFRPHRTHRTGTSVDFMSPVRRRDSGKPAVLPTSVDNKWGYNIDFNDEGEWEEFVLDLEALALHLAVLREVAAKKGVPLAKVVLFPPIRRKLVKTKAWSKIANLPFTKNEAWVRHDDHYHVDFGVRCEAF